MLVGFFGDLGSFKTATMSLFLREYALAGVPVYTNYRLDYEGCRRLDLSELFELENCGEEHGAIGEDEIQMVADSRVSGSKVNLFFGYFVSMSRKKGWDVFYSSQLASAVDLRIYDLTDLKVVCLGLGDDGFVRYKVKFGSRRVKSVVLPVSVFEEFVFPFYDTFEVIEPIRKADLLCEIERYNTVKINDRVDGIVEKLLGVGGWVSAKDVFRYDVEDLMLRLGFPLGLSKFVVNRIKSRLGGKKGVKKDVKGCWWV